MNAQHSSKSAEWYTPIDILETARVVLGGIDLDPASCAEANRYVGARWYFTKEQNGLTKPWGPHQLSMHASTGLTRELPSIWLNPPGGTTGKGKGNKSLPLLFWDKLIEERPFFSHALVLCFSLEQLATTQGHKRSACDFTICVFSKRIHFVLPGGEKGKSPSHANAVVYVPGYSTDASREFAASFSKFGKIMWPSYGSDRGD